MSDRLTRRHAGMVLLVLLVVVLMAIPAVMFAGLRDPDDNSVEAGFLRDMMTHHGQAVEMALIIRDRTDDEQLRFLATDILLSQQQQVGMMGGWLQVWDLSPNRDGPAMAWMGHSADGPMPGMATTEDIEQLRTLPVEEAEILFLRLMIQHHQGGVAMAQAYLDLGDQDEVSAFASSIVQVQSLEIDTLNLMLEQRGADTIR